MTKNALRGQYILNALERLGLSGDAYSTVEELYRVCQGAAKGSLPMSIFQGDLGFLLREKRLSQEGRRVYLTRTLRYEDAAAVALAELLAHNDCLAPTPPALPVRLPLCEEQQAAVALNISDLRGGA